MNNYIQLTDAQKQIVLTQCKNKLGLPEQAVEKDYWVTVMLQLIFDSELNEHIIFKGGTSLSKNGNLIERFSEDIDLSVNYEYFGLTDEPTKKQLKKLRKASSLFVREAFVDTLASQIERYGLKDQLSITVEPDGEGDSTYPEPLPQSETMFYGNISGTTESGSLLCLEWTIPVTSEIVSV